eukprot:SAG31_NODE_29512_length_394_cov_0.701695_1_plen_38_part_10
MAVLYYVSATTYTGTPLSFYSNQPLGPECMLLPATKAS